MGLVICRTSFRCVLSHALDDVSWYHGPMNNIGIYVDVQNIYYTTRQIFNRQFNFRALWEHVSAGGEITQAHAYAIERNDSRQRAFQQALRHIGFEVSLKPYIQRSDGSAKGDWDVGITIDVLNHAPDLDRVVLLSGDGDFDLLVQAVQSRHDVFFEVYGVADLTADSLKRAANSFNAIDERLLL